MKLGIGFANEIQIFLVEGFFLLSLGSSSFLPPATFAFVGIFSSIFFVLVDDEAFSNLCHRKRQLLSSPVWALATIKTTDFCGLLLVIVIILLLT